MPEVQMPRLSDTMQEGVLSRWLKKEGDLIHKGDVIAEIETDKATMELEAYDEGPLTALLVTEGTTVPIGQPIAIIGEGVSVTTAPSAPDTPDTYGAPVPSTPVPSTPVPSTPAPSTIVTGQRASPLVRKMAHDQGIDLHTVAGTGPHGRIVRADIEPVVASRPGAPQAVPVLTTAATPPSRTDDDEVPLTAIRRVTARRLTESAAVPHFYLTSVVDAERLLAFRADINAALADTDGKVSVTDLLVRACAVVLRAHPQVNSSWAGDKILHHRGVHIGVAVATDEGLIVPVVRDTDRKTLREIAAEARALAERAHAGTLATPEFSGGTFTISNLGMYAVDHFTALINPPEAAILAVGAATPEPVVRDGEVVVRSILKLTLSVDHRVVDGAPAAAFLRELKEVLQEPLRIVA
jgi:pyruvate dehydrogenase E2 component (dihydrolipoamide acetyltransferase)